MKQHVRLALREDQLQCDPAGSTGSAAFALTARCRPVAGGPLPGAPREGGRDCTSGSELGASQRAGVPEGGSEGGGISLAWAFLWLHRRHGSPIPEENEEGLQQAGPAHSACENLLSYVSGA